MIGDERKRDLKDAHSTYKQTISNIDNSKNGMRQNVELGLRNSNFKLGTSHQNNYVSEAKEKF